MLKELLSLFRPDDAISLIAADFKRMVELARDLCERAGRVYFEVQGDADERREIAKADVQINKLERAVRKRVITHLTLSTEKRDINYCLLMMSLVKDVERLGDYATNVAEIHDEGGGPLPEGGFTDELRDVRARVEATFAAVSEVFETDDAERAVALIESGRELTSRCDAIIRRVAAGTHDAATTTSLVLGARYYKRIEAHLLNVLSAVVMPLHKLDYFDEQSLNPDRWTRPEGDE